MNRISKPLRKGFTLIELTIAMMLGMAIGGMVLALFGQQLAFLRLYRSQSFLTEEAPMISMYVSRLVSRADRFRLHDSVADALAGTNPRLTASPVVVLNYRQPDGTMRASILVFQNLGTGSALYYYVVPTSGVLGTPQWSITNKPASVLFSVDQGLLRMTLTGSAGEQITFTGAMQQ
jgi:hypothetical protein